MTNIKCSMYLLPSKKNKKGLSPVYCRVSYADKKINLSTELFIEESMWDKKKGKVKPKHPRYNQLNMNIKEVEDKIQSIYDELVKEKEIVTLSAIKDRYRNKDIKKDSLMDLYNYYIKNMEDRINISYVAGTIKHYKTNKSKMIQFLKQVYRHDDISVARLDYEFITSFESFCITQYGNGINTTGKEIKRLKAVVNMGIKLGWVNNNPFRSYIGKTEPTNRKFLTIHELQAIERLELRDNSALKCVRDLFLVMAYTGLGYSDLMNLSANNITITSNNSKFIQIDRKKTNKFCQIPLFPRVVKLLELYKDHPESLYRNKAFPYRSNKVMNTNLKIIAKKAGVAKPLTTHIGRHTFATLSLENTIPIETVSKVLGHTSIKTTQIYAKVTQSKIENDYKSMTAFFN